VTVVLTWNVAGRVSRAQEQVAALAEQPADVVALQEIRLASVETWRRGLLQLGFENLLISLPEARPLGPDRRLGVLIASRTPLEPVEPPPVPWPERLLAAAGGEFELWNLHAPLSSKPGQVKVLTLEAVSAHLAEPSDRPRVLVGDLNTPRYESREGVVSSFARTRAGKLRPELGERHDRAELGILVGLRDHGYVDAFRELHGYGRRDRSWVYPNRSFGYRLDHILVRGLRIEACDYRHDWRDRGLSDHAAMWARFGSST
jgi:exonuclease III